MIQATRLGLILTVLVLFFLTGCGGIGPRTVARDRFEYTDAISESWKRQMLLNMVKIRYGDAPVFLDVASVINQYALEGEVQLGVSWTDGLLGDSQTVGGRAKYTDRPTITYLPLIGKRFTRSLMTPIPPRAILSLVQSGWRVDLVFRLCMQAVNGIYNRSGGRIPPHPGDPDFYRLIGALRKIQEAMAVGMRIQKTEDGEQATVLFFRKKNIDPEIEAERDRVRRLLGLSSELQEFKVFYGNIAKDDTEIAILSRSMLEILLEVSSYFDVPEVHLAEQRVRPTLTEDKDITAGVQPLIRVQSDREEPDDAFVEVRYRDHWFWIDDRDFLSKRMFSFLMFLFSLAETGERQIAPVLTVPAG